MLAKSIAPEVFVPARSGVAVDLDANLNALPPRAAAKGMFFADLLKVVDGKATAEEIATRAGVPHRRYIPFVDYPLGDLSRITVEVARVAYPKMQLGDALRLLGHRCYVTLLSSHAGRVLVMSLGNDIEKVFMAGPKAYRLILNFGRFWTERVGERHIRFGLEGYPAFIETYQVGVVEGVFEHFGVKGEVQICMQDIGTATLDITWQPKAE